MNRREFLILSLAAASCGKAPLAFLRRGPDGPLLNDVHSQLNPTRVAGVERPESIEALQSIVRAAAGDGKAVSIAGGRHAMGGQQFGAGTLHLDTRSLAGVLGFDREKGVVEVEAGIQWPELVERLATLQADEATPWGIVQKQTGADRFTLAGSISANGHGRGLVFPPLVGDVESIQLVDGRGELVQASRTENPELFSLAIGGYGLFGAIATVRLRLRRRQKVRRVVEILDSKDVPTAFARRIAGGFLYGDFQFDVDTASPTFLQRGVFSCYEPVPADTPMPEGQAELGEADWERFIDLTHTDEAKAFEEYTRYYLATSGQVYWSDTHQMSVYLDDYHAAFDERTGAKVRGSEMITEVYVPRDELSTFLAEAAKGLRASKAEVVYGTVRLIERDQETFLPWARESWACIVVNLHVDHDKKGIEAAKSRFRLLIDLALKHGGSYFLTYHRWALRSQLERAHPRFEEFLRLKLHHDPDERFQSDWYRHYRAIFA